MIDFLLASDMISKIQHFFDFIMTNFNNCVLKLL